jgi:hypothetical protein
MIRTELSSLQLISGALETVEYYFISQVFKVVILKLQRKRDRKLVHKTAETLSNISKLLRFHKLELSGYCIREV